MDEFFFFKKGAKNQILENIEQADKVSVNSREVSFIFKMAL